MNRSFLVLSVSCLMAGCAADKQARTLASQTSANIALYEAEVDRKIAAEKAFYSKQIDSLRECLGGNNAVTILKPGQQASTVVPDPTESLPYLRAAAKATREAILVSDEILSPSGSLPTARTAIVDYVEKGLHEDRAAIQADIQRQREIAETMETNLKKIDQQKSELSAVRKNLAALSRNPNGSEQLKELIEFGKAVQSSMKKDK